VLSPCWFRPKPAVSSPIAPINVQARTGLICWCLGYRRRRQHGEDEPASERNLSILVIGKAVHFGRKQFFWSFLLLMVSIGSGEAQIKSNSVTPGKPLLISPVRPHSPPPTNARRETTLSEACLSRKDVRGQHLKFRTITGRRCWYAARSIHHNAFLKRKPDSTEQRTVEAFQGERMPGTGNETRWG
jgi:hypothetical protein